MATRKTVQQVLQKCVDDLLADAELRREVRERAAGTATGFATPTYLTWAAAVGKLAQSYKVTFEQMREEVVHRAIAETELPSSMEPPLRTKGGEDNGGART